MTAGAGMTAGARVLACALGLATLAPRPAAAYAVLSHEALVDATWEYGSTDGEIFTNIKDGIGPKFDMKAMKAKMMDTDIWNVVNYLRSVQAK